MKYFNYLILCLIMTIVPASSIAAGFETLYDSQMLMKWKATVEYSIPYELREKLLGSLNNEESRMVQQVKLVLNQAEKGNEPFCYYVKYSPTPDGRVSKIHISLATLRFWRDICLAYAWLETNGYGIETVSMYMSMMKYRMMVDGQNPRGQYTRPLEALRIPKNAFDDTRVGNLYDKLFNSSIYFILAHELGHVRYRHNATSYSQSRRNEAQADEFALELMRRVNIPPMGMAFFFTAYAHFVKNQSDFNKIEDYQKYLMSDTHPLEGSRAIALGNGIRKRSNNFARIQNNPILYRQVFKNLGTKIIKIGKNLNSASTQLAMTLQGSSTTLKALAPKRPGKSNVSAYGIPHPNSNYAFHGIYKGKITDLSGSADVDLVLYQNGKSVRGVFSQGLGVAFIEGHVSNDRFVYNWHWSNSKGKGFFSADRNGQYLTGHWGNNKSQNNRGKWELIRK